MIPEIAAIQSNDAPEVRRIIVEHLERGPYRVICAGRYAKEALVSDAKRAAQLACAMWRHPHVAAVWVVRELADGQGSFVAWKKQLAHRRKI